MLKDKGRRDYTLNPSPRGPTNGVQFILLVATLLRLALDIATTRLILANGPEGLMAAGYIIGGFSKLVMSGDFVIGLIVFAILITVNFVVITKGATRIAEVGARIHARRYPRQANGDRRRSFSGTDRR